MSEQTSEALRAWFKRIEPVYPELFNTAHVICGNYDQAEYALRCAILDVWAQNADSGMGFREKLRNAVRAEALRAALETAGAPPEFTWPGFPGAADDPILRQAGRERIETQRLLMLRHGVGFSPRRIAQLTGMTSAQVRDALDRFESRCRRSLPSQERSRFDALFSRLAGRALSSRGGVPHPVTVYRAFEAEASQLQMSDHRVSRVIYRVLVMAMALVCAMMFWLFAVLVQSPDLQTPGAGAPGIAARTAEPLAAPEPSASATSVPAEDLPPAVSEANFAIDVPASIETTYETE